ncbi:MAG: primosomal protein N', partial [Firmicutes bacterium]|nr:primosomal protein N' [Bacillota bacterium]
VISADVSLNIPDYRSPERTFQLITQAAGRAGRGDMQGRVIIQTYTPDHYAVTSAAAQDYETFYQEEIFIRKQLQYPPFSDLIQLVVAAEDEKEAASAGTKIREAFLRKAGQEHSPYILGPHEAPINKVNGYYRQQLLVKVLPENLRLYTAVIDYLRKKVTAEKDKVWLFSADINPYSFL